MKYYIGLDIGGTKIASIISNEHFKILSKISFKTIKTKTPEKTISKLIENINIQLNDLSIKFNEIKSIGISCGGPLNSKKGIILSPPNLPYWDNVKIIEILKQYYNIPIFLQNDANACAMAEWKLGAGKGMDNMIFLTFGTGLGAGFILNGKLYTGKNDMAGEVGHIRLSKNGPIGYNKNGSFEGFCSGAGLYQISKKYYKDGIDAKSIFELAEKNDEIALKIIKESAIKLGYGLSILIDMLNPEGIIIGSIYSRQEKYYKNIINEIINKEALFISKENCQILPAKLGDSIGDYGSLIVASGKY